MKIDQDTYSPHEWNPCNGVKIIDFYGTQIKVIADEFQVKNKHINFLYGMGIDSINSFFNIDNKFNNFLSEPLFKIIKGNKFLNNYATFLSD